MGPSYADVFVGFIETNFPPTYMDQNLIFTNALLMTALALLHPTEKNLSHLLTQSILFTCNKGCYPRRPFADAITKAALSTQLF